MSDPNAPESESPDAPPEAAPPPLYTRKKLAIEQEIKPLGSARKHAGVFIYGLLSLGAASWAVYNATVQNLPPTSPYVIAPAVGAVWFAIRVYMSLTPKG